MRISLALIALAACGGGGTRALDECPGERPTIADCYVGEFFADCGGTGDEPVLGCNDQGRCWWFTGGCAPEGFEGSSCGSDNVCCHDDWPFPNHEHVELALPLSLFGTWPWDRTTATNVSVTVDPTLTASATTVTCTGSQPAPSYTPCDDPYRVVSAYQSGTTIVTLGPVGGPLRAGWELFIEIVDDGTGTNRARVCAALMNDQTTCYPHQAICAASGTVAINQLPVVDVRQLTVSLDVQLSGLHVVATLVGML